MKENLSKKCWNVDPTQNFVKCPKLVRERPRAIQKIAKNISPKSLKFGRGRNFVKCPKLAREPPPRHPKNQKHMGLETKNEVQKKVP